MNSKNAALASVLLLGLAIRIWNFPAQYQLRDGDELGYISSGPLVWEGIEPGMAPAGPLTWLGWTYSGLMSMRDLLFKTATPTLFPSPMRPFFAIENALFDIYRDMSTLRQITVAAIILAALGAIWSAFHLGYFRAGLPGGILTGGLAAMLPVFVAFSGMARPYMFAWSFALIAQYFAAVHSGRKRWAGAAAFLGLSIASRVDMVLFAPLVLWELLSRKESVSRTRVVLRFTAAAAAVSTLASPWLLTHLLGNLRAMAAIGAGGQQFWSSTILELAWVQGLGPLVLMLSLGLSCPPAETRRPALLLIGFLAALAFLMMRAPGYGVRHHGAFLVALVVAAPVALRTIRGFAPAAVPILVPALLLLPSLHSITQVMEDKGGFVTEEAAAWVEEHVPPGETVYLYASLRDPLPTRESADSLWSAVTCEDAWQTKFRRGLSRFQLSAGRIPRALSMENLIHERCNRRRWFILGANPDFEAPRYDIRIMSAGSPFDWTPEKAVEELQRTGGVMILPNRQLPEIDEVLAGLGPPAASWTNEQGRGTRVYCSPGIRELWTQGEGSDSRESLIDGGAQPASR